MARDRSKFMRPHNIVQVLMQQLTDEAIDAHPEAAAMRRLLSKQATWDDAAAIRAVAVRLRLKSLRLDTAQALHAWIDQRMGVTP